MTYSKLKSFAEKKNASLLTTDKRFTKIFINHADGSRLFFNRGFFLKKESCVIVFTDHFGYFIFHSDDLLTYGNMQNKPRMSWYTKGWGPFKYIWLSPCSLHKVPRGNTCDICKRGFWRLNIKHNIDRFLGSCFMKCWDFIRYPFK